MDSQKIKELLKRAIENPFVKTPLIAAGILLIAIVLFFSFLHIFSRHGRSFPIPDFTGLTIERAEALAKEKRLRLEITDSVFIMTREPGTIVEQNPSSGTYVKANRRVLVTSNANNPLLVEMPNLVGMTLRQARSMLHLQVFRIGSLSFTPDIAINNVLEQYYQGKEISQGTLIPKGSDINLLLGRGLYGERTVLPRVIGLTLAEARNLLHEASLNLGRYTYDATIIDNLDSLQARIYSQYPNPTGETNISFGARVDIWLTLNESRIPPDPQQIKTKRDSVPIFTDLEEEILE
jgi:eukaryotic-like serine/threonine-protein kinase